MRPWIFVGSLLAAFLLWLNDSDHFTWTDLADSLAHLNPFHHEPWIVLFLVIAGIAAILPKKSKAGAHRT